MINKVLRLSRPFPLGSVSEFYNIDTYSGAGLLIFVKINKDFFDVLCFRQDVLYFCRYQFPRYAWYIEDVLEYLKSNL